MRHNTVNSVPAENAARDFDHQVRRRLWSYAAVGAGLTLLYGVLRGTTWQGTAMSHTGMEVIATALALIVGAVLLHRYRHWRNTVTLIIGVGFIGTGFLDGYHALVTSAWVKAYLPSDLPSLILWSWVASRLYLACLLYLSYLAWRRERHLACKLHQ